MTGLVDWAAERARMILAMIALSLTAGIFAYTTLPKEGEPDIEIPVLFVSVVFPGISAADSEALLVRPIETELADLDGLKRMTATAAENYAGVAIEFEFGWDKAKTMADARDAMNAAEALFPEGAEKYSINEINFSMHTYNVKRADGSKCELSDSPDTIINTSCEHIENFSLFDLTSPFDIATCSFEIWLNHRVLNAVALLSRHRFYPKLCINSTA